MADLDFAAQHKARDLVRRLANSMHIRILELG